MRITLRTKKSAGKPVTIVAYRHIKTGNAARDHRDWTAAAAAYRAGLTVAPQLGHIWVQLGHVLKEAGHVSEAVQAYQSAIQLNPDDSDALLHLGHALRFAGDTINAARSYVHAVETDPNNLDAVTELHHIVVGSSGIESDLMVATLKALVKSKEDGASAGTVVLKARQALTAVLSQTEVQDDPAIRNAVEQASIALANLKSLPPSVPPHREVGSVFFDISDLIGFFGHNRLPTGIQRVQIEVIANRIALSGQASWICCYNDDREGWLEIPLASFNLLAQLSLISGDRKATEWIQALTRLHLALALSEPIKFPDNSCIVTLGASWGHPNYFLALRRHKLSNGLRYIPFIHDFVPVFVPQYHIPQLTEDFLAWVVGVFQHADGFLVNSEATKNDLLKVAATLVVPVAPTGVAVVHLDADLHKQGSAQIGRSVTVDPRVGRVIASAPFVLMVATLEPRKGHVTALKAWQVLIRRHGRRCVPRLVCVGGKGWMNEAIHDLLTQDTVLASYVTLLSNLSDDGLGILYQACQFTIYPSLYEGWGLPITEALCYGKPVIASDVSSLPEAGGAFASYFAAGSHDALADAVERMSFDVSYRNACAAHIVAEFRPRTWQEIATQIETEVARLATRDRPETTSEPIRLGKYYKVARTSRSRIWDGLRSGESVRMGDGWLWPEEWGCWTRMCGGELRLSLSATDGPLQVALLLRNVPSLVTSWTVRAGDDAAMTGTLLPNERCWIRFRVEPSRADFDLSIRLTGDQTEALAITSGSARREDRAAVGLEGFHIHPINDDRAGVAFLEAATFGTLDLLDAYAEPSSNQATEEGGSATCFVP